MLAWLKFLLTGVRLLRSSSEGASTRTAAGADGEAVRPGQSRRQRPRRRRDSGRRLHLSPLLIAGSHPTPLLRRPLLPPATGAWPPHPETSQSQATTAAEAGCPSRTCRL